MNSPYFLYAFLALSSFTLADSLHACESVIINQPDNSKVAIAQKAFNEGLQELAIIFQPPTGDEKITRLSFAGSKQSACHFPSFTLLKGGEWGWHVLWTSSANQGVFYARVDGEAWVSSLPKRLSREVAELVAFKELKDKLIITAKYPINLNQPEQQFISEDEGRSWDSIPP